jgi:hypothetical protein
MTWPLYISMSPSGPHFSSNVHLESTILRSGGRGTSLYTFMSLSDWSSSVHVICHWVASGLDIGALYIGGLSEMSALFAHAVVASPAEFAIFLL